MKKEMSFSDKMLCLTPLMLFCFFVMVLLHAITDFPGFAVGAGVIPFIYIFCLIIICRPTEDEKCTR